VKDYLKHLVKGKIVKYKLPGINGWNFVCTQALDGGGLTSLQIDKQGKTFAQQLLTMQVLVPSSWNVDDYYAKL